MNGNPLFTIKEKGMPNSRDEIENVTQEIQKMDCRMSNLVPEMRDQKDTFLTHAEATKKEVDSRMWKVLWDEVKSTDV